MCMSANASSIELFLYINVLLYYYTGHCWSKHFSFFFSAVTKLLEQPAWSDLLKVVKLAHTRRPTSSCFAFSLIKSLKLEKGRCFWKLLSLFWSCKEFTSSNWLRISCLISKNLTAHSKFNRNSVNALNDFKR